MINCHASRKPSALQHRFPNHHHRSCASVGPSCISQQSFKKNKKGNNNNKLTTPKRRAQRKNEALAGAERASLEASLSCLERRCSPRATSRLPHLPGRLSHLLSSLEPSSPQRHIPGDSSSVTRPTRRAAARGSKGGKGAAEGGAAARSRSPRPDTKRPARATCSHPARGPGGISWLRPPSSPQSSVPRLGLSGCPGRCPGQPRRAAAAKAKAGGGAREETGSREQPLTRAPGSCPGLSGALSEVDVFSCHGYPGAAMWRYHVERPQKERSPRKPAVPPYPHPQLFVSSQPKFCQQNK
ncbi:uncharacterized protein [Kogia breviceps]|uniref:uncharacterized protein n=1 Tax=Kogia breviceps TaxID=27615 RepID=UPI0034D2FCCE